MQKPFSINVGPMTYTEEVIKRMSWAEMYCFARLMSAKAEEIEEFTGESTPDADRRRRAAALIHRSAAAQVRLWIAERQKTNTDFYQAFHAIAQRDWDPDDVYAMEAEAKETYSWPED